MFSFRTTPIEEQLDRALRDGKVGVFCSQNSWNPDTGRYIWEIFRDRGNLEVVFSPMEGEFSLGESHIEFDLDKLSGLSALVVDVQDTGARYCEFSTDLFRLMCAMKTLAPESCPSLYVVDHINPAGRIVEGTMPAVESDIWTPKVAHRHGLTLGELAHLYHNEIAAEYPLHIVSAFANPSSRLLPWAVAPAADVPGMFTCLLYPGVALWRGTSVTPGIGTSRPYEYFGAPFIKPGGHMDLPEAEGALMRPCSFTPAFGQYAGEKCFGYQILLLPGTEYHSLLHSLQLMGYFLEHYSQFVISDECLSRIADPVIEAYLKGNITFDIVQEHIKTEEQKWIRKAKRYTLYDDQPFRIK